MADFTSKSDQLPRVSPSSSSSSLHSPLLHNSIVVASASSPAPPIPAAAAPWGLHSPAANRFAAAKNDDDGTGDFGRYMSEKKRKLREQFQADFSSHLFGHVKAPIAAECLSNEEAGEHSLIAPKGSFEGHLFKGVSIFVNGFTIPSHSELRGLMMKYGGRFENYFSRSRVTHIVCSTLPDSKIKDSRSFSRGLPIVKPDWIVDSIAQGKLLHWASYQPERVAYAHPHQQKLSSFFGSDMGGAINDTLQTTHAQVNEENLVKEENKDNYAKEEESKSTATAEEPSSDSSTNEDVYHNWENAVDNESLLREDDSSSGKGNDHQNMAPYAGHSTLVDKNFVQNFFKRSRLHFIGTWRSRYHGHVEDKPRPINESLSNQTPAIIHIDMDCFFVAVVVRNRPQMAGKPVAVCHSDSARGTAEISSANYTARAHGVHAGMFVRDAKACCPSLEIVPYDFEGYEEVAEKLYDILHKHCNQVQALSCDEAYLDVTGQGNPELIAESIRSEIFDATKCTASAGIATNVLLARLATKRAKPNGQYYVKADEEEQFMADLPVGELPGVGWALKEKLHSRNLSTCHQLRTVSKEVLQKEFGLKTGDMLWCYARGIDNRKVIPAQERKSIGAEVNWGVRFRHYEDARKFLGTLCEEVSTRLQKEYARGRTFTLKVKRRKNGAGEPAKFMGCGSCDNFSRSSTLAYATNKADVLLRVAEKLYASLQIEAQEVRGVGLQVTKLDMMTVSRSNREQKGLESWLASPLKNILPVQSPCKLVTNSNSSLSATIVEMENEVQSPRNRKKIQADSVLQESKILRGSKISSELPSFRPPALPPMSQLDRSVLESLPPDIFNEIDNAYNGLLANKKPIANKAYIETDVHSKNKVHLDTSASSSIAFMRAVTPLLLKKPIQHPSNANNLHTEHAYPNEYLQTENQFCKEKHINHTSDAGDKVVSDPLEVVGPRDFMPVSFSQIDKAVLKELPTQLQRDLLHALPAHSAHTNLQHLSSSEHNVFHKNDVFPSATPFVANTSNKLGMPSESAASQKLDELWNGLPPKWVRIFHEWSGPGSRILRIISSQYQCRAAEGSFASFLLSLGPFLSDGAFDGSDGSDEVVYCVLELVKQYIQPLVSVDLEEVWKVLRLVKRISIEHRFWSEVQNLLLPPVQLWRQVEHWMIDGCLRSSLTAHRKLPYDGDAWYTEAWALTAIITIIVQKVEVCKLVSQKELFCKAAHLMVGMLVLVGTKQCHV